MLIRHSLHCWALTLFGSLLLSACGSDSRDLPPPDPNTRYLQVAFNQDSADWSAGFADYPAGQEDFFELSAGEETLPAALNTSHKGFALSGNNHSDDLFMFIASQQSGLEPNTRYALQFKVVFGTNAQKNCVGTGGAPGESVWIKVGASQVQPVAIDDGAGNLLMNIDKGQQETSGSDAITLGNFANNIECGSSDTDYHYKTLVSSPGSFTVISDAEGKLWMLLGTDSGFESTTKIYFIRLEAVATKLN